jgi:ATP-dependent Clp protease adaptor protein ClpS
MKNEVNKEDTAHLGLTDEMSEPSLYQVVLHDDDFTPMEFVIHILEKFLFMDRRKAAEVTVEARVKGKASCGIFSKDFAESKVSQMIEFANSHEHPLMCSTEVA